MMPPEIMNQIMNHMQSIAIISKSSSKQLLVVFMTLCMIVGFMAVGYTFADLVQQLKHLDEIETQAIGTDSMTLLTSILVVGTAIGGMGSLFNHKIEKLKRYAGFVLFSLLMQIYCTLDKAYNMTVPACRMTQSFAQNVKELGLVEQRWIWDGIQSNHACCGLNSPNDYLSMNRSIPMSCCAKAYASSYEQARKLMYKYCIQTTAYYKNGCLLNMLETQNYEIAILVVGAAILIGIQLCGMLLAMCIARNHQIKMKTVKVPASI